MQNIDMKAIFGTIPARIPESRNEKINNCRKFVRELLTNSWFQWEMGVTTAMLARALDIRADAVTEFRDAKNTSAKLIERLDDLKHKIARREAVFAAKEGIIYLFPPEKTYHNALLVRFLNEISEWNLYAYCRQCGKNQYLPIIMNDENYAACYHCIPPSQYRILGAERQDGSLIRYALAEMEILSDIEKMKPAIEKPVRAYKPKTKKRNGWAQSRAKRTPARFMRWR